MDRPAEAPSAPLAPLQRILLATDGTVTHVLEAYAGEPVEVVKISQAFTSPTDRDAPLELSVGEKVLRRRVVLRGAESLRTLLYAEAVVAPDRVDPAFLAGLLDTDKPIGILLAEGRTETFREILDVCRCPAGAAGPHFGVDPCAEVIARTYRIVVGGRPAVLVMEMFPPDRFRGLPD